eukprot:2029205-Amphidinium_carterae.1
MSPSEANLNTSQPAEPRCQRSTSNFVEKTAFAEMSDATIFSSGRLSRKINEMTPQPVPRSKARPPCGSTCSHASSPKHAKTWHLRIQTPHSTVKQVLSELNSEGSQDTINMTP